jgi:hypothetical protein
MIPLQLVHDIRANDAQVRPPMPPTYFFAIDVSAEAVSSGVLQVGLKIRLVILKL